MSYYEGDGVMPWGKFEDCHLSNIPTGYLKWVLRIIEDDYFDNEELITDIEHELDSRSNTEEFPFGKFEGKPMCDVPTRYLMWTLKNMPELNPGNPDFWNVTYDAITEELEARK